MTYQPQNGDRVRVVLEGEVFLTFPSGVFRIGIEDTNNTIHPTDAHVVSVEKVTPPLPTTPGSVITFAPGAAIAGMFYVLQPGDYWTCGGVRNPADEFADEWAERGGTVIFDAGAES